MEHWKTLPSDARYEISTYGRVRSLCRAEPRLLRPGIASNGYPTVAVGKGNTRTVHSLVAETFLGPCPEGHEILHADGRRDNPKLSNLRYGTRSENNRDAVAHGTRGGEMQRRAGLRAAATKDSRYPTWRREVFRPGGFFGKEVHNAG